MLFPTAALYASILMQIQLKSVLNIIIMKNDNLYEQDMNQKVSDCDKETNMHGLKKDMMYINGTH